MFLKSSAPTLPVIAQRCGGLALALLSEVPQIFDTASSFPSPTPSEGFAVRREPRYDTYGLHVNRRFMLAWARDTVGATRILDFGCGDAGGILWGRRHGIEVLGTDLSEATNDERFAKCTDTTLPFEDASFDAIVSNMVFEHVMHPPEVLAELHRVLRPNGAMIHMWPSDSAIFEGHCRLLFAQNLRSSTYLQICHALHLSQCGKKRKSARHFAEKWLRYMEEECNYLPEFVLRELFLSAGFTFEHTEDEYLRYRLGFSAPFLGRALQRVTTMVIVSRNASLSLV
jgi:SAM-dependent methyltransferase